MAVIRTVLCIIVDFASTEASLRLSLQLVQSRTLIKNDGATRVHILIVDNGNLTPVRLTEEQRNNGIDLLRSQHNDGYAGGIRVAVERVGEQFDAFWFLNSDLEVDVECLPRLLAVLDNQPKVGAVGPTVFVGHGTRVWGARGIVNPTLG